MSSSSGSGEDKIRMPPPDLREEVVHYIDELLKRSKRTSAASFQCVAEGTLEEPGTRYSSLDLQHKALEWRGNSGGCPLP
jgi:hypothetical protein